MILIDFNQIVITRIYMFNSRRNETETSLFENKLFPKALARDIFDFVRDIHYKYGSQYGDVVMCADGKGPTWRKEIFPEYKASRKNITSDAREIKDFTHAFIDAFYRKYHTGPVIVYSMKGIEADDIIGHLVLTNPDEKHMIVSRDKDFHQLHNSNVVSYDYQKKRIVREDGKKKLEEHIICGDRGDGIPNILSDGDTFVTEGKRQNAMTKKRFNDLLNKPIKDIEILKNYNRNRELISLYDLPQEIVNKIEENLI